MSSARVHARRRCTPKEPPAHRRRQTQARQRPAAAPPGWSAIFLAILCLVVDDPGHRPADQLVPHRATTQRPRGWWTVVRQPVRVDPVDAGELQRRAAPGATRHEGPAFINSFVVALPATVIPILIAAFAAYAFTFMEFWGRDVVFVLVVGLLVVPNQVAFVPLLQALRQRSASTARSSRSGWPTSGSACRSRSTSCATTCRRLPKAIIESAKIDGAVLPLGCPGVAVLQSNATARFSAVATSCRCCRSCTSGWQSAPRKSPVGWPPCASISVWSGCGSRSRRSCSSRSSRSASTMANRSVRSGPIDRCAS